jgi:uncharacterized membrane protein
MDTFIGQHWNDNALWVVVAVAVATVAILSTKAIADRPYFGGGRGEPKDLRKERYLRGEITTEEYVGYRTHE